MSSGNQFRNVPPKKRRSQGAQARESDDKFQSQMQHLIERHDSGFCVRGHGVSLAHVLASPLESLYHTGACYLSVNVGRCCYGREFDIPFVLRRPEWPNFLAVIHQTQDTSGSADAKIVKRMLDLKYHCEIPSILVMGGRWFERQVGIQQYAYMAAGESGGKILQVLIGQSDFTWWAAHGFQWPASIQLRHA